MNRYYSAGYGRFLTADPSNNSAGTSNPESWNKYGYAAGDPLNFNDPFGMERSFANCDWDAVDLDSEGTVVAVYSCTIAFWQSGGTPVNGGSKSKYPECNPSGNPTNEKTLSYLAKNYSDANVVASEFDMPVAWLLGWGAMETNYGTNAASSLNNNFFSEEKPLSDPVGPWANAIACPQGAYLGAALDNPNLNYSCFSDFESSAGAAMQSKYGSIITSMLENNPNASIVSVFTAVYAAGWDTANPKQAAGIIAGTQGRITSELDCLKKNAYIK